MIVPITRLKELIDGKTVAVVGNGPTANQFDHAQKIDAADIVIRFNRFRVGPDFPQVGQKTTIIACPLGWRPAVPDDAKLATINPALILGGSPPKKETQFDEREVIAAKLATKYDVTSVPEDWIVGLQRQVGCRPTTGFIAMAYILDECKPKSVYTTGFSFGITPAHHYFPEQTFRHDLHDPRKELHVTARRWPEWKDRLEVDRHMLRALTAGQPSHEAKELRKRGGKPYSKAHRWVYDQIAQRIGGSVIEIGAGIGYGCQTLLETGKVTKIVAVEPDKESYNHVRGKLLPNVMVYNSTLQDCPTTETFDSATCVEVAEHLPAVDVHPFLTKIRTMAPRLYLSSPDRRKNDHGRRTPLEWTLALEAAGWKVTETITQDWAVLLVADRIN